MTLDQFAKSHPDRAAGIRARLDQGGETGEGPGGIVLRHESSGAAGSFWLAFRETNGASILLNGYRTGLYAEPPATVLGEEGLIAWRNEEIGRMQPAVMASGEQLRTGKDYVGVPRERYIVGDIGTVPSSSPFTNEFELTTWSDAPTRGYITLSADPSTPGAILIGNPLDGSVQRFDFGTRTIAVHTPADPLEHRWAAADGIVGRDLPYGYAVAAGSGPAGPLVVSMWPPGSVRLRDATTGNVIGQSLAPPEETSFPYRGSAEIVPGTEWVAGKVWWNGEVVLGVVDLRRMQLISRFEHAPDVNPDWDWTLFAVSPDGAEAALRISTKIESYFAVWDVKTGKLIYGLAETADHDEAGAGEEMDADAVPRGDVNGGKPRVPLPRSFGWHPKGDFVAIHHTSGSTELRRNFASAPFATIDGVESDVRIQPLDGNRVLVETWSLIRPSGRPSSRSHAITSCRRTETMSSSRRGPG